MTIHPSPYGTSVLLELSHHELPDTIYKYCNLDANACIVPACISVNYTWTPPSIELLRHKYQQIKPSSKTTQTSLPEERNMRAVEDESNNIGDEIDGDEIFHNWEEYLDEVVNNKMTSIFRASHNSDSYWNCMRGVIAGRDTTLSCCRRFQVSARKQDNRIAASITNAPKAPLLRLLQKLPSPVSVCVVAQNCSTQEARKEKTQKQQHAHSITTSDSAAGKPDPEPPVATPDPDRPNRTAPASNICESTPTRPS
ncbi:unnamed protein product [Phytophthora fragariaefolia]|uniref:Unnamed protein product n=1 Tax=Phytophthora fragariaefolia TaxID=1490495 RepID=A0A9W6Y0E6_9STRA|nr:unnamed protein product [Phytophthora fragariaefolia]